MNILPRQPEPSIQQYVDQLNSNDPSDRINAARSLGYMQKKAILAVPYLLEMLKDDTCILEFDASLDDMMPTYSSVEAASALGKIGDPSAIPALIEALLNSNFTLAREATSALGKIGDSSAVSALIKQLSGSDHILISNSVVALGQIGDKTAVDALILTLQDANTTILYNGLAKELVLALGYIQDKKAVNPLINLILNDDYWYIHEFICSSLAVIGDRSAIDTLINCLLHAKPHIRIAACNALKEFRDNSAIPALIKTLCQDQAEWELRWLASDALGTIGRSSSESLLSVIKKGSQSSRILAVSALGIIKEKNAVPVLIQTLQDRYMRETAAKALGEIGAKSAVGPLIEILQEYKVNLSESKNIRKIIAKTLSKLTGHKCGGDPIQWQNWWEKHKMELEFVQQKAKCKSLWQFWK